VRESRLRYRGRAHHRIEHVFLARSHIEDSATNHEAASSIARFIKELGRAGPPTLARCSCRIAEWDIPLGFLQGFSCARSHTGVSFAVRRARDASLRW
jgi:hypothetical protein